MRSIIAVLAAAAVVVVVTRADDTKPSVDRVGQVLARVGQMGPAEQQAWLRHLEQRQARATKIVQRPEEAAKETNAFRGLLHRKLITWKVLREAVERTDAVEQQAVMQLAKRYRKQVFESFGAQIEEHGRWQEAWTVVLESWQMTGGPFDQQGRLIDWLEAAIRSAAAKSAGRIPERPEFGGASRDIPKPGAGKAVTRTVRKPEIGSGVAAAPATINAEELTTRIAGYNLAIRALEADMDENGTWDAARLTPMIDRLKVLVVRYDDLKLFRDLVPAIRRSGVAELDSTKTAISQLGARIFAARNSVSGTKFSGTDAQRRAEIERLEKLSRRLAELGAK